MEKVYVIIQHAAHLIETTNKPSCLVSLTEQRRRLFNGELGIYKTKEELTAISRKYDIKAIFFFDGRGGHLAVVVENINSMLR
jgi:phosphoenolpyruvate carboxylase